MNFWNTAYLLFHNDGKEDVYIGSADVMERNIDNRVEVLVRLLDHKIRQQVIDILEIQWSDNMKALKSFSATSE